MENRTRERLTGAAILVALVVLLVPELLSGPRRAARQPAAAVDEPPIRSYTMPLDAQQSAPPEAADGVAGTTPSSGARSSSGAGPTPGAGLSAGTGLSAGARLTSGAASSAAGLSSGAGSTGARAPVAAEPAAGVPAASARMPVTTARVPAAIESAARAPAERVPPATESGPAKAVAREPAARRSVPGSGHGWAVQVGSFGSRENAERLARQLQLKGYGAFVSESTSRGRKWYRVRVGPERDRAAAAAVAARLRSAGHKGAVVQPR